MMRVMRLDLALGALTVVAVLGVALISGDFAVGGTVPVAAWLGLLLLFRRRWPIVVLALSVTVTVGGTDIGTPGLIWPATVAYVTALLAGHYRWVLGIGLVNVAVMVDFARSLPQIGLEVLWLAAALAATYAYISRDKLAAMRARSRLAEERLSIARELHDVVAHTLAVVGIHLNVAADALDEDPAEAREALRLAQVVRGQAMDDLRSLVGILRAEPLPNGLPDLYGLVARTADTGLAVQLDGDLIGLPAPVAQAVYRVTQEGLTNVLKHADATSATVTVTRDDDQVMVTVSDDGRGGTVRRGGHGLDGMRERVGALGGSLVAGPTAGGFTLFARLPLS